MPREGPLRSELEALEWQTTVRHQWKYGFPEGMSGDLVMALALAIRQLKQTTRGIDVWGGEPIVVEEETFEDKVRRLGSVFPGD